MAGVPPSSPSFAGLSPSRPADAILEAMTCHSGMAVFAALCVAGVALSAPAAAQRAHEVGSGDTMSVLARRYRVDAWDLALANGMQPDRHAARRTAARRSRRAASPTCGPGRPSRTSPAPTAAVSTRCSAPTACAARRGCAPAAVSTCPASRTSPRPRSNATTDRRSSRATSRCRGAPARRLSR